MLKAKKENGEMVFAFDVEEKLEERLRCPECSTEVIFKNGKIKVSHFAHKTLTNCSYGAGESQDHMFMKKHFYLKVRNKYPGLKITLEDNSFLGRRADISIRGKEKNIVVELQRSPIKMTEIIQRTLDYNSQGCHVMWIFHLSRIKSEYFFEKGRKRIPNELMQMQRWGLLNLMCSNRAEIRKVKFTSGGDTKTMRKCSWEDNSNLEFKFVDEVFTHDGKDHYLKLALLDYHCTEYPKYEAFKEKRRFQKQDIRVGDYQWSW